MPIVRYSRDQIAKMRMTPQEWARLEAMTPEEIERNALEDPDNPPSTDEELERACIGRDIRLLRQDLGLSQEQFADRFHINLARLRDWEQARHKPDSVAIAYLKVIRADAALVEQALAKASA